jgi:hypothetical protein
MNRRTSKMGAARDADAGKPVATLSPKVPSDAWGRDAVTFRLTEDRKRALRALSPDDASLSPTSALDLAIERAVAREAFDIGQADRQAPLESESPATSSELRETLRAVAEAAREWAGARAHLARVADDCADLRAAIEAASASSEGAGMGESDSPLPIRAWLDRAAAPSWLVAQARWVGTRPAGNGMALWTLELRELGRGENLPTRPDVFAVELGPADAGGPLSRLDRDDGCVISCSRAGEGWALSLRPALEGGRLGAPFAELAV